MTRQQLSLAMCVSWAVAMLVASPVGAEPPSHRTADRALACDPRALDPHSYRLTTNAQAHNVTRERYDWWDGFAVGTHNEALYDLNLDAQSAAERARDLDPRNLMAHGQLARTYLILDEVARADEEWRRVLDAGAAITWTATLYDVDYKSYFLLAFDRAHLRIYRFGQFSTPTWRSFGMPEFPGADAVRFWEATGGCLDPSVQPEAIVPWSDVHEIKAGNWVLWFKLTKPIVVSSDRGKRKTLREIKANLHGATGTVEFYISPDRSGLNLRGVGIGPTAYQQRVRGMIAKFADPAGRIRMPAARRGAGW